MMNHNFKWAQFIFAAAFAIGCLPAKLDASTILQSSSDACGVNSVSGNKNYFLAGRDLSYQRHSDSQKLDIYTPTNRRPPYKTVVFVHGGCFTSITKDDAKEVLPYIQRLTSAGYAVVSLNYRLAKPASNDPAKRNSYPASMLDVQDAVRWVRLYGKDKYNLETEKIVAFGYSAGATLASYLGTRKNEGTINQATPPQSATTDSSEKLNQPVDAVIDFFGRVDFAAGQKDVAQKNGSDGDCAEKYLGKSRSDSTLPDFRAASVTPTANSAHFLIVHGTDDTTITIDHSEKLAAALKQAHAVFEFHKIKNAKHMFETSEDMKKAWKFVCLFLKQELGESQVASKPAQAVAPQVSQKEGHGQP